MLRDACARGLPCETRSHPVLRRCGRGGLPQSIHGAEMSVAEVSVCFAVLALAAFTQGVFGLGFAMVATPLLALFLEYRVAVVIASVPMLVIALHWLLAHRKALPHSGVPPLLIGGIVLGALGGMWLQVALPQQASLLLLAALLAFSVAVPWGLQHWQRDVSTGSRRAAPAFGILAGVTESALNVGAPFMVLFAGLSRLTRAQQLIALNLCFFLGKIIQLSVLLAVTAIPMPAWTLAAAVGVCLVFHTAGDRLAGRFPDDVSRRWLGFFLSAMVVALVLRAWGSS